MPIIQLDLDTPNSAQEIMREQRGRAVDKITLLVKCYGDERLDTSPMALVDIDKESAGKLLAKLKTATDLSASYHESGDSTLASVQFLDSRPDYFDSGIFFDAGDELDLLGDLVVNEHIVLLSDRQAQEIRALLEADKGYRNLRKVNPKVVIDPPINGSVGTFNTGQVYWEATIKHTSCEVATEPLTLDLLEEIAEVETPEEKAQRQADFEAMLEALVDDE